MPNHTLCIDTSAGTSVAVLRGAELLAEFNDDHNMGHTEVIGRAIATALADAGVASHQIKRVVVGRGPAPFTGLRVGIAAATMFAAGVGAKLFGVVSLDAIAFEALSASEVPLLVTADARRSEVYWALYSGRTTSGAPICIEGPGVIKPAALEEMLSERGINPMRTELPVHAAALGQLFEAQLIDGIESTDLSALYLRAPDAVPTPGKKVSG
ncbi:tRNA (adenosine(37)-N6)-threonylcarbamoyltransferase complex dimerization subunit type 1 TsaB [Rhodoluna sp.]|uniref:tRNA (adenosine(37)-N6)-threonylcarbamoyltransferase complex dimerization subunit type 1 TsaB n=1 Tax=Rhodoluna sp. TaxID=1969481 RepID=UPI0025D1FF1C|nr:tRNA (adenosine(37)-N6)-threonylcarbamoyltransferase complex dimerization subunit type 1 TsaB [Rhodoluna sp.]